MLKLTPIATTEPERLENWLSSCPRCRGIVLAIRGQLWNPDPTEWGLILSLLGPHAGDQDFAVPAGCRHAC
jgi:hypothetical protein